MASIVDISLDATAEFVGTASIDGKLAQVNLQYRVMTFVLGQVVIQAFSGPEKFEFDKKRPMRTIALEPNFAKRGTRAFVCGGMAGALVLHEKGWLGHKETVLHPGESPVWQVRWRANLISWAVDLVRRFLPPSFLLTYLRSGRENLRHSFANSGRVH